MSSYYRPWGGNAKIGQIYVYSKKSTMLGHNNLNEKLRDGDLLLCTAHSGDCFYNYRLIRRYKSKAGNPRLKLVKGFEIGSYQISKESKIKLTERQFHLLMAGLSASI
jgi:hypothetical protein